MAYIKRVRRDGTLLVGYRQYPGGPELFGICPTSDMFDQFKLVERQHHRDHPRTGIVLPSPTELYPVAPTLRPDEASRPGATLSDWIGRPSIGKPGNYFEHARPMGGRHQRSYEQLLGVISPLDKMLMCNIRRAHIVMVVRRWLECPACASRAADAHLELTAHQLAVSTPAFDGRCVDEDGNSTHYPTVRRATVRGRLRLLSAAFNVARNCDEPVCEANPVAGYPLGRWEERPTNEDLSQALSHLQLRALSLAHPAHLEAVPKVGAYGLLRRSEIFGLNRGDITFPGPADEGVAHLDIARVYVADHRSRYHLRRWGKTAASTHPVELARPATESLRKHMDKFRSTSNPRQCEACADGLGEWSSGHQRNPHRHCDFADDAPAFVNLDGRRQDPDDYTGSIFPLAVAAAGLTEELMGFKVTPKILRATGGTLLLELGVADETVKRMGRWTNIDTLKRHYTKLRDKSRHAAAVLFGEAAAVELGLIVADDAPLDVRLRAAERRTEVVEAEVERLRAMVAGLGGEPTAPAMRRVILSGRSDAAWDATTLRNAIAGSSTRREILARLGVSEAGKHYRRLENLASALGLELPPRWGKRAA